MTTQEKLNSRLILDEATGCLIWQGARNQEGYGLMQVDKKLKYVHRLALEFKLGRPIAPGMVADHLCRRSLCCEGTHLEEVTKKENTLRGLSPSASNAVKTECPYGHPYNEENTAYNKSGRLCRTCRKLYKAGKHPNQFKPRVAANQCTQGHGFTPENTLHVAGDSSGKRRCRQCIKERRERLNYAR